MNYYEKNSLKLKNILRDAERQFQILNTITYEEKEIFENEKNVITVCRNDRNYAMTSVNRETECELLTREIDFNKDNMIIVHGSCNVSLLKYIAERSSNGSRLLILESDRKLLKYCLEHYDYSFLKEHGKCIMICSEEFDATVEKELYVLSSYGWENLVYNISIVMLPNYHMKKEFMYQCIKHIREILISKIKVFGNSFGDILYGFSNNFINIQEFLRSNRLSEIKDKYKGYPAIIVSAGPSLEKNIHHIKKANGKALIIACDACVSACEEQEVCPDAMASIERVTATHKLYYKGKKFDKDMVLVGPTILWPDILKEFSGKRILLSKLNEGPDRIVMDNFENIEHENIGMSSAHVAFRTAVVAGCNPIILVGQDLAFTDDKIHSDNTHTVYEGENDTSLFDGSYTEDINGKPIKTNETYNCFRNWFEMHCIILKDRKIIDATEGGAKIKGTEVMSFEDAINQYCIKKKEKKMVEYLEDIQIEEEEEIKQYKKVIRYLEKEIVKVSKLKTRVTSYYEKLEEIYDRDINTMTKSQLVNAMKEMEEANRIVDFIIKDEKIKSYFIAIIKQTIFHIKAVGNEMTSEMVMANLKLQGNLMGMIKGSCDMVIGGYQEMIEHVEQILVKMETKAV